MDSRDRLLVLLETLYDAPGDVDCWRTFLFALCTALDGTAASFISHDLTTPTGSFALTARVDSGALKEYLDHWIHVDPWAHSPRSRTLTNGTVIVGDEIIPRLALKRTAFYNDFSRKYDIAQSIVSVIEGGNRALSGFSINGSDSRAAFGAEEMGLLRALMPHLQRALQMHRRLVGAEAAAHRSKEALDQVSHGILILDAAGRLIHANHAADLILRARDGITLDHGELRAATPGQTAQLRTFIAGAIATTLGRGLHAGGLLALDRPSGRRPLRVVVAPVAGNRSPFGPEPTGAMVFVTDPDQQPLPTDEEIRTLFGLTAAEARLVRVLAEGLDLALAAHRLGLSIATLRSRLKTIFEKTETHRQSELIQLIRGWPLPSPSRRLEGGQANSTHRF